MATPLHPGVRQAFFFAVLLAVPVVSYFVVFKPQNQKIARAKEEIQLKETMLDKLREATAQQDDLLKQNLQIRESISSIESKLPNTKEMDNVLREVATIADTHGLRIPNFKKGEKPLAAGLAMEQPLELEIVGDFDGFYAFLLDLEKLPRQTRVPSMVIDRVSDKERDGQMKAKFTLSIYYQQDGSNGQ